MTATVSGVKLIAVAYNWSSKGTSYFISTCGTTTPGDVYETTFVDDDGYMVCCTYPRPQIASFYYRFNTLVDDHNNYRQNKLHLEGSWPTQNPWFRILTSVLGQSVVDMKQIMNVHDPKTYSEMSIRSFVDRLVSTLQEDKYDSSRRFEPSSREKPIPYGKLKAKSYRGWKYSKQKSCVECRWHYLQNRQVEDDLKEYVYTTYVCPHCKKGLCSESRRHGARDPCWVTHPLRCKNLLE